MSESRQATHFQLKSGIFPLLLLGFACLIPTVTLGQGKAGGSGQDSADKVTAPRVHRLGDNFGEEREWEPGNFNFAEPETSLKQQVDAAEKLLAQGIIGGHAGHNAVQAFIDILATTPGNVRARAGLAAVRKRLRDDFGKALAGRKLAAARDSLKLMVKAGVASAQRLELASALSVLEHAEELFLAGQKAESVGALNESAPKAVALYREALGLDDGLVAARKAMADLRGRLIAQSRAELAGRKLSRAMALAGTAERLYPDSAELLNLKSELLESSERLVKATLSSARAALQKRDLDAVEDLLAPLQSMGNTEAGGLLEQVDILRRFGGHRPGDSFSDTLSSTDPGPMMLVLPTGSFQMGAANGEPGYTEKQGAQVRVRMAAAIAMEKTETSIGQFSRFVEATGYQSDAERGASSTVYDPATGRTRETDATNWRDDFLGKAGKEDEPVIHVSWKDAQAYTRWLSGETGEHYRLPSEAEFEYALRAGTGTAYWWGDGTPTEVVENLAGGAERFQRRNYWPLGFRRFNDKHWGPAAVGSFKPNPFGFYDLGGNVAEWTMDCFLSSLEGRPATAVARLDGSCLGRVVKGGFWSAGPLKSGSAGRFGMKPDVPDNQIGFRVVRELNPIPRRQAGIAAGGG